MRALFEIAKSGLYTAERSLSVTAHNVANADTPGFSRQRVNVQPAGQSLPGFSAGLGVNMSGVARLRNELIDLQLHQKRQDMGYLQQKASLLEIIESSFASDSGGDLDVRISRFFNGFSELANDPQDSTLRNNLVTETNLLTGKLNSMSRSLDQVRDRVQMSITDTVAEINHLLKDLAAINKSVVLSQAKGQPDHNTHDLQTQKLEQLSRLVDLETQVADNGGLEIRVGGVQVLTGDFHRPLVPDVDIAVPHYGVRLENNTQVPVKGGELAAAMEIYNHTLTTYRDKLDLLAETLVREINIIHNQGFGLEDDILRDFFDPDALTAIEIRINEEILQNHNHIAASSEEGEAGNGENAVALAHLREERLAEGSRLVDFAVRLISEPGSELSGLRSEIETRDSEIRMLSIQQERESGVNIDEELSLMIQYQNAYQGAARIMAAAQNMYDTLISMTR